MTPNIPTDLSTRFTPCPKGGMPVKLPKPLKKISEKKQDQIMTDRQYYAKAILNNITTNKGKVRCEECGQVITTPTGRNVHHIIAGSTDRKLYHDIRNHFILGKGEIFNECNCGPTFDNTTKPMKIRAIAEERKEMMLADLATDKTVRI